MLAWILEQAGLRAGLPDRRRAARTSASRRGSAAAGRAVRDRGRRVRHRLLRQAQQVRPLPAAHRDPQQPRVRPRRHLRRTWRRSSASSTIWCAPCRRQGRLVVNARDEALQRVLAMGCWSEVQRFGGRKEEPGMLRARGEPHAFDVLRGGLKVARVEWALLGEHNQLNALAAIAAAEHVGVAPEVAAAGAGELRNVRRRLELRGERRRRRGLRRLRAPPDRDPHDHRRPAPQGRRRRASSPSSSRARTP